MFKASSDQSKSQATHSAPFNERRLLRFISNPTARIAKLSIFPKARERKLKNSSSSVMKCTFHPLRFKIVNQCCIYAVSGMEGHCGASKSDF